MKRRKPLDAYVDDDPDNPLDADGLLKDGRSYRCNMLLADSAPAPRTPLADAAPHRFRYGRGFLSDANTGHIIDRRPPFQATGNVRTLDSTEVYYSEKAKLSDAWRAFGPEPSSCCGGCADHQDQAGTINHRTVDARTAEARRAQGYRDSISNIENEWRNW
jgi:hypothetical protein